MKLKLQTRTTALVLSVITSVIILLSGALLFQFRRSTGRVVEAVTVILEGDLLNQLKHRGATLVKYLSRDLVNPLYLYDVESMNSILSTVKKQEDVQYVYLYNPEGLIIHDGVKWYAEPVKLPDDEMGIRAREAATLFVQTSDDIVDVAQPILIGDDCIGGVRIGLSKNGIQNDIRNLRVQLNLMRLEGTRISVIVVGVLALLLCGVGIWCAAFLGRRLSRPIINLAQLAARVGRGDYQVGILPQRSDEIGDLAVSFKTMAEDLQKKTVSKQYVDNIIAQMIDTLAVVSLEGMITKVNHAMCDVLGYKENELVGEPFQKILADELFRQTWSELIQKNRTLVGVEVNYLAKNGRKIAVQFSGALLYETAGETVGMVCVAQDITQLKKHEKFAAIGQLAASVAHELRNPLGAIQNALFYIKDTLQELPNMPHDENLAEFIDISEKEIKRSNQIVSELLDYSREIKLRLFPTDIPSLLEEASHAMTVPEGVTLSVDKSPVPITMVDPQKMHQVFVNLAINAVQAMPNGGALKIATFVNGDASNSSQWINVHFQDTGSGISEENIKHIFEPLFTTKTKGTGLGLAICQEVIKAHSGRIEVQSQVGKGSTFIVKIPYIAVRENENG